MLQLGLGCSVVGAGLKVEVVVKGVNDKLGCKFFGYQWERAQLQGV